MWLRAEFTTEPFVGEGDPPAHAVAALHAARDAGLECEFGPLGTTVRGDADDVVLALADVLRAAIAHGATRVKLEVEAPEGTAEEAEDEVEEWAEAEPEQRHA